MIKTNMKVVKAQVLLKHLQYQILLKMYLRVKIRNLKRLKAKNCLKNYRRTSKWATT